MSFQLTVSGNVGRIEIIGDFMGPDWMEFRNLNDRLLQNSEIKEILLDLNQCTDIIDQVITQLKSKTYRDWVRRTGRDLAMTGVKGRIANVFMANQMENYFVYK